DSGWYNATGSHTPTNTNYLTGQFNSVDERSFFVFDLATVTGNIVGAELRLANPSSGYSSPDPTETLAMWDVTTPIATLTAGGSGLTAIYNDLGTGTQFGLRSVSAADNNTTVIIPLNPAAVTALNAQRGSQFAI